LSPSDLLSPVPLVQPILLASALSAAYRQNLLQPMNKPVSGGFYIFIFLIFVFYKNIFSFSKFTRIYPGRPAAGRPGPGRPAAGRQGLICKNFRKKITFRSLKDRSPGSGAAGPG